MLGCMESSSLILVMVVLGDRSADWKLLLSGEFDAHEGNETLLEILGKFVSKPEVVLPGDMFSRDGNNMSSKGAVLFSGSLNSSIVSSIVFFVDASCFVTRFRGTMIGGSAGVSTLR
jgi:hypothetical protein